MNFLIYGAGALGQALGCLLATDGNSVDLVLRERFISHISVGGLRVSGMYGEYNVAPSGLGLLPSIEKADKKYDYILITTKTYDTAQAIRDLSSIVSSKTYIVSMQNGCGNLEQIVAEFGEKRSIGARVITGFEIKQPGEVIITVSADDVHVGASVSGVIPEYVTRLANTISSAGLPCKAVADIHASLFAKLLYNCTLNPLGAILGVHYGILSESEDTQDIMNSTIEETFAVIHELGAQTPWKSAEEYRQVFYEKLIPLTYKHRPSMLQDLENGKPTEVEALVGYVSTQGRKVGVKTPTCDLLTGLVRFKESQNLGVLS